MMQLDVALASTPLAALTLRTEPDFVYQVDVESKAFTLSSSVRLLFRGYVEVSPVAPDPFYYDIDPDAVLGGL